ncbi:type I-F CRISPR-associated endoribonuclease Cas6/Csy4 [Arsenophonus endosymbiont of Bemisia tabaci Asia II 3]|nr:type I-F CRISPR-associated endoribonuclease Cas6/Csy4 [Arsenophonus endosymbiont of Bemisia tabaci Asia II 3]
MNYYQEITLLPDPDITLGFLWQKIYQQLHIALVDNKVDQTQSAVAVDFPEYGYSVFQLGKKLRLLATEKEQLSQLNIEQWLTRFSDYAHIKVVELVPSQVKLVSYIRQHIKGENRIKQAMLSKAQRWSAKTGKPLTECLRQLEETRPHKQSSLPFIWLDSQQTKQRTGRSGQFPLFIKWMERTEAQNGTFTCYGLSQPMSNKELIATVPHF